MTKLMRATRVATWLGTGWLALSVPGCLEDNSDDCTASATCPAAGEGGVGAQSGPGGGGTSAGGEGGGGTGAMGGAGAGGGPQCDDDSDCTQPDAARCNGGSCVPCNASPQCAAGVAGLPVCDAGACVACKLGEEDACVAPQTCDLLAKTCVDVTPLSVQNCRACTNDAQCATGHRCIEMNFEGQPHGFYCLEEADPGCAEPFAVFINKASISGANAVNYCGIEDLATCEAVNALLQNWRCSGTPGMCSPDGILPEQAVPGALCEQVGALANRCTYACDSTPQCPAGAPQNTCGNGDNTPPGWCGG